jgi:hypothetical protein
MVLRRLDSQKQTDSPKTCLTFVVLLPLFGRALRNRIVLILSVERVVRLRSPLRAPCNAGGTETLAKLEEINGDCITETDLVVEHYLPSATSHLYKDPGKKGHYHKGSQTDDERSRPTRRPNHTSA